MNGRRLKLFLRTSKTRAVEVSGLALKHAASAGKFIYTKKWLFIALASLPVLAFFYQYLATGNKIIEGDFDYYAQMYEAFRISLLQYGQFPSWNAWMSGGLPLYANPQFGLIGLQTPFVLLFGTLYGLKLAFVAYALLGFWGMYLLGKSVIKAPTFRALLIAYVWVFCGFFTGHGISHFTFALFFLLPWLILFLHQRKQKWSWLWFGLFEAALILTSIHYAFLMTSIALLLFLVIQALSLKREGKKITASIAFTFDDLKFFLKAGAVVLILSIHRIFTTIMYVSSNERLITNQEINPTVEVLFSSLFLPIGSLLPIPNGLQWTWGEYSMYVGIGCGLVVFTIIATLAWRLINKRSTPLLRSRRFVITALCVGAVGFLLALGDFSSLSPYNILHQLPGFTQTRVPGRWLLLTMFALLILILAWRRTPRLINFLLALSVLELFLFFGPPSATGQSWFNLPKVESAQAVMSQYDSDRRHLDMRENIEHSYFYSTQRNVGLVYTDDSVVNNMGELYGTSKCGANIDPNCKLVLSNNAEITYWSPNRVVIDRTAPGEIELNMNVQAGWRVNDKYIYHQIKRVDPAVRFMLPNDGADSYEIIYAPKLSPSWIAWRIKNL